MNCAGCTMTSGLTLTLAFVAGGLASTGCRPERADDASAGLPAATAAAHAPERFGLGHSPTGAEIARIDIDANPAGAGLPPGEGTYAEGAKVFAGKCAFCHGPTGEGQGPYPRLIGAEPTQGFPFGRDFRIAKTIGNYWPYPTTVYDYIHRAMPFNAPGSLTPGETYSLVAYLLAGNGVIARTVVINAQTLPTVQMPARNHFVLDDRKGGQPFR